MKTTSVEVLSFKRRWTSYWKSRRNPEPPARASKNSVVLTPRENEPFLRRVGVGSFEMRPAGSLSIPEGHAVFF
jgi:hypothetical protein